jgi:membrane fusion protein
LKLNRLLALGIIFLAAIACAVFGLSLPRISRVSGYVTTTIPPVKIHSPSAAVVVSLNAKNGALVEARSLIMLASTERAQGRDFIETRQRAILNERRSQFDFESARTSDTSDAQAAALKARAGAIGKELTTSDNELALLKSSSEIAQRQHVLYQSLAAQGFVSSEGANAKQLDAANTAARVYALERARSVLERELAVVQLELQTISQKTATQLSQYKRDKLALMQELNESEAKKIEIVSPVRGVVTQLQMQPGQVIRPEIPIAVIVPADAQYELMLLVPSKSVGFVMVGQEVSVRYQAFPHEHYGRHKGVVKEIAQVALLPNEIPSHMQAANEPLFTVKVALPTAGLSKNGAVFSLSPGMLADADIQLDRLKIYQWLLQPLFRLGGRL